VREERKVTGPGGADALRVEGHDKRAGFQPLGNQEPRRKSHDQDWSLRKRTDSCVMATWEWLL
jgi:hypothetical protein